MKYFILIILLSPLHIFAQESKLTVGKAYNSDGKIVYIEKHYAQHTKDGLQKLETKYYTTDNKYIGVMNSDFTISPYLPNYSFIDQRFGREEGSQWNDDKTLLNTYAKENKDSKKTRTPFAVNKDLITGQGLHAYLFKNLKTLIGKDSRTEIDFLIPMNKDSYSFHIERYKLDAVAKKVTFKVEMDNWLLRLFAPHLEITYDTETRELLVFKGPSNLLSAKMKTQNVNIIYERTTVVNNVTGEAKNKEGSL